MTTGLADFFKYNLWANLRLLEACAQLTDEQLDFNSTGIYGSIRETLLHIFAAEEHYVRACHTAGAIPPSHVEDMTLFPGFDGLRERAQRSGTALITIAEQANLNEILHLDGNTYDAPVIVVLIQAVNHGIDHRSQIATILSQQGIKPPRLDGWGYNNDMH